MWNLISSNLTTGVCLYTTNSCVFEEACQRSYPYWSLKVACRNMYAQTVFSIRIRCTPIVGRYLYPILSSEFHYWISNLSKVTPLIDSSPRDDRANQSASDLRLIAFPCVVLMDGTVAIT